MSVILATILCTSFACTPITNNVMKHETEIAGFNLPYSAGQATNEFYDYNSELFYLNETRLNGADPGALYVSEEDVNDSYGKLMHSWQYKDANGAWQWQNGKTQEQFEETYGTLDSWHEQYTDWYYMIYTGELGGYSAYNMFRSHDLNDWKPCGRAYNNGAIYFGSDSWSSVVSCWAPEFIRDPDSGMYFIFFSAQSKNGNAKTTYGPNNATTGGVWDGLTIPAQCLPILRDRTPRLPLRNISKFRLKRTQTEQYSAEKPLSILPTSIWTVSPTVRHIPFTTMTIK